MSRLGRSALARHIGVSRQTVYQYEKEGKIPPAQDGGWDPDEVSSSLAQTLGKKRGGLPRTGERAAEPEKKRHEPATRMPVASATGAGSKIDPATDGESKSELERIKLREQIEKLHRDNEEESGALVRRKEVVKLVGGLISTAKTKFLAMGTKLGPQLAIEGDAGICKAILDAEVNEILAGLCKWVDQQPEDLAA